MTRQSDKTNAVASYLLPTSVRGWLVQVFGTYLGFLMRFVGVFQATNLHTKIGKRWRAIRTR